MGGSYQYILELGHADPYIVQQQARLHCLGLNDLRAVVEQLEDRTATPQVRILLTSPYARSMVVFVSRWIGDFRVDAQEMVFDGMTVLP